MGKTQLLILLGFVLVNVIILLVSGISKVEVILSLWNSLLGFGFLAAIIFAVKWGKEKSKLQGWGIFILSYLILGFLFVDFDKVF